MTSGIYCIKNNINGKVYVGKSINIENRLKQHRYLLTRDVISPDVNRHLYNSVQKNGIDNFSFDTLEVVSGEYNLTDRELHWMIILNSTNREFGYNLRMDSSTKCYVHPETIELMRMGNSGENNPNYGNKWTSEQKDRMSDIAKERHASGVYGDEWKEKLRVANSKTWLDDEKKAAMAAKVSKSQRRFLFDQYTRGGVFIREWDSVASIVAENPTYKWQNIYSVCNGYKKTYMGYIWKKKPKK